MSNPIALVIVIDSLIIASTLYSDPTKKKVWGGATVNYGWLVLAFVKATFQTPSFVILIHS